MSGRDTLPVSGSVDDRKYGVSSGVGHRVTEGSQRECCDVPLEGCSVCGFVPALTEVEALRIEVRRLEEEITRLRTVMHAAAEEIGEHWDAHCDLEGYGPSNLVRRLRDGTGYYPQYAERIK